MSDKIYFFNGNLPPHSGQTPAHKMRLIATHRKSDGSLPTFPPLLQSCMGPYPASHCEKYVLHGNKMVMRGQISEFDIRANSAMGSGYTSGLTSDILDAKHGTSNFSSRVSSELMSKDFQGKGARSGRSWNDGDRSRFSVAGGDAKGARRSNSDSGRTMSKDQELLNQIRKLKSENEEKRRRINALEKELSDKFSNINKNEGKALKKQHENEEKFLMKIEQQESELSRLASDHDAAMQLSRDDHDAAMQLSRDEMLREMNDIRLEKDNQVQEMGTIIKLLKDQLADSMERNSQERQKQLSKMANNVAHLEDVIKLLKLKLKSFEKGDAFNCNSCDDHRREIAILLQQLKGRQTDIQNLKLDKYEMKKALSNQEVLIEMLASKTGEKVVLKSHLGHS